MPYGSDILNHIKENHIDYNKISKEESDSIERHESLLDYMVRENYSLKKRISKLEIVLGIDGGCN